MGLRRYVCLGLALFFASAGVLHFTHTDAFATIVPPPLPPAMTVQLTGAMELVLAAGLLVHKVRRWTGVLLALYCAAVLPANIYMAIEDIPVGNVQLHPAVLWLRVILQLPLIALILWASAPQPSRPAPKA
ncbi:MAG: hypothetical protein AAGF49_06225 [Pseudomonadota bacterium]